MRNRASIAVIGLAVIGLLAPCLASEARADWLFVPFVGGTFGAKTAIPDLDQGARSTQPVYGGSAGWLSPGVLGIDIDFGYSPRFFEGEDSGVIASSNVATVSLDFIFAAPTSVTRESLRPYVVVGGGWMHAAIEDAQSLFPELFGRARNSVGVNLGGGAIGFFTPRTGIRFDIRQFRSLERDANPFTGERSSLLSYWRATVGVVIRR